MRPSLTPVGSEQRYSEYFNNLVLAADHSTDPMNFGSNLSTPLQRRPISSTTTPGPSDELLIPPHLAGNRGQRYTAMVVQPPWANQSHCAASVGLDSAPETFAGSLPVGPLGGYSANSSSCGSSIGRIQKGMMQTEDEFGMISPALGATEIPKEVPFGMPGTLGSFNGSRVMGTVQRFHPGGFGFLQWHPFVGVKVKVHCPLSAITAAGEKKLTPKDVVEFTIFEGPKGARAEAVQVIMPSVSTPPSQLHLDNYHRPSAELEPFPEHAADNDKCRRCLAECLNYKVVPSRLRVLAEEYLNVISKFAAEQEDRIKNDVGTKSSDGNPDHLEVVSEKLAKAWQFLSRLESPITVPDIMDTHAMLGEGCCTGPGQFRTKGAKVGQIRLCHHMEVPAALERYVEGLKLILEREDLSANAKSAWAGYNILAIHPFIEGNGRLSRLLINWVLKQCGSPFPLVLYSSEEHRTSWREAVTSGHVGDICDQPSQPLAGIIAAAAAKCWNDIELETDRASRSREEVAEDRALRMCRERAQGGSCSICLDDNPNTMVLCCGVSYHFSCLTRWLSTAPEPVCPTCRAAIPAPAAPSQRGRNEVRVMEVGFPFDFRPGPDLVRELDIAARMVGTGLDRRWEEVLSRAGVEIQAQAICTFCPNQRALNCTLDACARCCTSTQRRYGLRCIRHPVRASSADAAERTTDAAERRPQSNDTVRSESDSTDEREPPASNLCIFCDNRRAVDCALFACRNCCLSRAQACPRHSPSGPPGSATNSNVPNNRTQTAPPPGAASSSSSSSGPSGLVQRQQVAPQASSHEAGAPARRSGICAFCPNRAAMECVSHACRSCCISRGGPCAWHARSNARTTNEGAQSETRDEFFHTVPSDLFSTAVMNAGNARAQASASASSLLSGRFLDTSHRLDLIPQTHLSNDEATRDREARDREAREREARERESREREARERDIRGLPLSSSAPLDPRSPIIVLNDDLATRCRLCPNAMATGCVHNACRRCCMNQGGLCPRHF